MSRGCSAVRKSSEVRFFGGYDAIHGGLEFARGGRVKLPVLVEKFGNDPLGWNILYLVSSALPDDWWVLVRLAKQRGAKIVLNQNGVAYPAWHGWGWRLSNLPLRRCLRWADHVLYQSEFCKKSADRFLGKAKSGWEILRNPVDTNNFSYMSTKPKVGEPWRILLGGTQYQSYRVESAIRTLGVIRRLGENAVLTITGRLCWMSDEQHCREIAERWIKEEMLQDQVQFVGAYSQNEMPEIFRSAHILLHTKVSDPCPTVVVEGMAAGLPVVYPRSGGVPELVGQEAGIGVDSVADWEKEDPASPISFADAVMQIFSNWELYSAKAFERSREFDTSRWLKRHEELFAELCS